MQAKIERVVNLLQQAVRDFSPVCFANSLGAEDMVLTDLIVKFRLDIEIFSLDTGRLPEPTYDLMQQVSRHYGNPIKVYFPDSDAVEKYIAKYGPNGFYESTEARKACCYVRKVEPLRRALRGKKGWITGMRRDQAVTRSTLEVSAYDPDQGLQKFNPLLYWSNKEVWAYIRQHDVPYNKLHDQFYPSLGCAPCTRSISPGEDIRAGRWWWENPENKECGLHVTPIQLVPHGYGIAAQDVLPSEVPKGIGNPQNLIDQAGAQVNPAELIENDSGRQTRTKAEVDLAAEKTGQDLKENQPAILLNHFF